MRANLAAGRFARGRGFVNRVDIRPLEDNWRYMFRPTSGLVTSWGPLFNAEWTWDHTGLRLDTNYYPELDIFFRGKTRLFIIPYNTLRERLRPRMRLGSLTATSNLKISCCATMGT